VYGAKLFVVGKEGLSRDARLLYGSVVSELE
jgi:hypothetical protein